MYTLCIYLIEGIISSLVCTIKKAIKNFEQNVVVQKGPFIFRGN